MATDSLFCKIYILLIGPYAHVSKLIIPNAIDLVLNEVVGTDLDTFKSLINRLPFCSALYRMLQGDTLPTLND